MVSMLVLPTTSEFFAAILAILGVLLYYLKKHQAERKHSNQLDNVDRSSALENLRRQIDSEGGSQPGATSRDGARRDSSDAHEGPNRGSTEASTHSVASVHSVASGHNVASGRPDEWEGERRGAVSTWVEYTLTVKLIAARNLISADSIGIGKTDPYAIIRCGDSKRFSYVAKGTATPYWGQDFVFKEETLPITVTISLFDWDIIGKSKALGITEIVLAGEEPEKYRWFPLHEVASGEVHLGLSLESKEATGVRQRPKHPPALLLCREPQVVLSPGSEARKDALTSAVSTGPLQSVFGLPLYEKLLDDLSCAMDRTILYHGRMYVTPLHLCFHSNIFGKNLRVVLPMKDVEEIQKSAHGVINPAILVFLKHGSGGHGVPTLASKDGRPKYMFASFWNRNAAFRLLQQVLDARAWLLEEKALAAASKALVQVHPLSVTHSAASMSYSTGPNLTHSASLNLSSVPSSSGNSFSLPSMFSAPLPGLPGAEMSSSTSLASSTGAPAGPTAKLSCSPPQGAKSALSSSPPRVPKLNLAGSPPRGGKPGLASSPPRGAKLNLSSESARPGPFMSPSPPPDELPSEESLLDPVDGKFEEIMRMELPLNADLFFHLCLSDDSKLTALYHRARNDTNLKVEKWHEDKEAVHDKGGQVRQATFRALCQSPMCPDDTAVTEIQRVIQAAGAVLLVDSTMQFHDVPYGSYFQLDTRWVVVTIAENACVVTVFARVTFLKDCLLRNKITFGALKEYREDLKLWLDLTQTHLMSEAIVKAVNK